MPHKMQIQYDDMENIAKMFDKMEADIEESINKINAVVGQLEDGDWQGLGAMSFFNEYRDEVEGKMKVMKLGFETGAEKVRQVISQYQDAEQTILSFFASIQ